MLPRLWRGRRISHLRRQPTIIATAFLKGSIQLGAHPHPWL